MSILAKLIFALGLTVIGQLLVVGPAEAQAIRTWVSGVGDDANPCSRTAPCKTFAGAISKTAAGGEINCLDPGGFGAVTITKSITIDCSGTFGSILAAGTNGIIVNASGVNVRLRGLAINGGTSTSPGINGIRFLQGASLTVENVSIYNFTSSSAGNGIAFQPSGSARLHLTNVTISSNGSGSSGGGILIQPTGASGSARVELENVRLINNGGSGLRIDTTGNTSGSGVVMNVIHSEMAMNNVSGISLVTPTSFAIANVTNSSIFNNATSGLAVNGAGALIRASGNLISLNGIAVSVAGGGSIRSYNDNIVEDNTTPSSFVAPDLTKD